MLRSQFKPERVAGCFIGHKDFVFYLYIQLAHKVLSLTQALHGSLSAQTNIIDASGKQVYIISVYTIPPAL